eukprot:6146440-Alexandrium_andersonii.AAC.1
MSASLVGSEMCIRDRRKGSWAARLLAKPAGLRRRAPVPDRIGGSAAAVSYTHLTLPTICSV